MASPSSTIPILPHLRLTPLHSSSSSSFHPSSSSYNRERVGVPRSTVAKDAVRTTPVVKSCISSNVEKSCKMLKLAATDRTGPSPHGYVRMKSGVLKKAKIAARTNWRGVAGPPPLLFLDALTKTTIEAPRKQQSQPVSKQQHEDPLQRQICARSDTSRDASTCVSVNGASHTSSVPRAPPGNHSTFDPSIDISNHQGQGHYSNPYSPPSVGHYTRSIPDFYARPSPSSSTNDTANSKSNLSTSSSVSTYKCASDSPNSGSDDGFHNRTRYYSTIDGMAIDASSACRRGTRKGMEEHSVSARLC